MRIGLIGASGHYGFVLDGLRELSDLGAELVAVAPGCMDEDLSPLLRCLDAGGRRPGIFPDYRRMLDEARLDLVGVNPPYHLHAEVCAAALARGVAPYCEKPLALDLASLASLRRAQQLSGRPVGLMLNYRYESAFHTARLLVQSGAIGEPVLGYAQKSYKLGRRPDFYRRRETFGGLIPWVGIHAIDWFQWVSGRRFAAVTARHGNHAASRYPGLEDHAVCLFELDNGGSAVMSFDYLRPGGADGHGDDRLRLMGSAGSLEIRHPGFMEVTTADGPLRFEITKPRHGPFGDFARAAADGSHACLISTAEAFAVTEIALRAREAADTGERVRLDDGR